MEGLGKGTNLNCTDNYDVSKTKMKLVTDHQYLIYMQCYMHILHCKSFIYIH